MITIESWTRNPEGTYDVTIIADGTTAGQRYTYQFYSQPIIHKLEELCRNKNYRCAAELLKAFAVRSPGHSESPAGRPGLSEDRKRPAPAETKPQQVHSEDPGAQHPVETGNLFEGGPFAARENNAPGSVMLYPY